MRLPFVVPPSLLSIHISGGNITSAANRSGSIRGRVISPRILIALHAYDRKTKKLAPVIEAAVDQVHAPRAVVGIPIAPVWQQRV